MWIRMLAYPGKAELSSLAQLPVAVDVQVRKVTEYLGVADTKGQPVERVRTLIQRAWEADVRRFGAVGPEPLVNTPSAVDPALWFFGRWGCTRCEQIGRKSPICEICQECGFDDLRCPGLGKWADGGRVSDGLVVAMSAGNAAGAKQPCCSHAPYQREARVT
jgi:hypothetical protein